METKMTIRGIGTKLEHVGIPYALISILISYLFKPHFEIGLPNSLHLWIGSLLLIVGLILHTIAAITMVRGFKRGILLTTGLFKYSRNPMYVTIIFMIIPGLSLLLNSWLLLLSIPLLLYILFKNLHEEEIYLEKTFGQDFISYKQKTAVLIPGFFIKKK